MPEVTWMDCKPLRKRNQDTHRIQYYSISIKVRQLNIMLVTETRIVACGGGGD